MELKPWFFKEHSIELFHCFELSSGALFESGCTGQKVWHRAWGKLLHKLSMPCKAKAKCHVMLRFTRSGTRQEGVIYTWVLTAGSHMHGMTILKKSSWCPRHTRVNFYSVWRKDRKERLSIYCKYIEARDQPEKHLSKIWSCWGTGICRFVPRWKWMRCTMQQGQLALTKHSLILGGAPLDQRGLLSLVYTRRLDTANHVLRCTAKT